MEIRKKAEKAQALANHMSLEIPEGPYTYYVATRGGGGGQLKGRGQKWPILVLRNMCTAPE